ncbi:phage baseplate protein [Leptolyngbya sp. FACHB-16]|uniref:T4 family baseplate hub assembly chaperone n=1 Tax=unclassified Leptolyngbya TaxID=2650499 RepID=UPI0016833475|nr:phage baseplate protein [Leptolyngbya sp. FACHB-16]MBD2158539.1 phage baseplate protein [Leptolyngbya sp. FACHB-16]
MRPLSANDVITIWELGQRLCPWERAISLLSVACPNQSQQQLAMLSVGQRDRRLLALRQMTIGSQLNCTTTCPKCGGRLEFALNLSDICVAELTDTPNAPQIVQIGDFECQFRLPNSYDLALLADARTFEEAYHSLVECCVFQVSQDSTLVSWNALPVEVMTQLTQYISSFDPQAEILLDLDCPNCQYQWQPMFDIVSFFWTELDALARHLLQEVHTLAKAYGWHEVDILSMTATRRQLYLDIVS